MSSVDGTGRWARLLIISGVTVSGALWLWWRGPFPVIRVTTTLTENAPFWYMITAFPALGILAADVVGLWRRGGPRPLLIELVGMIGLLLLLGATRIALRLPISGHALVISHLIARRLLLPPVHRAWARLELAAGLLLLIAIAYPKLAWWNDPITLGTGAALGIALAVLSRFFLRRFHTPEVKLRV